MTSSAPQNPASLANSSQGLRGPRLLSTIAPNALARVVKLLVTTSDAARIKSLGICVGRRLQLVKAGDPLIVRVLGARVGLSRRLAEGVEVELV